MNRSTLSITPRTRRSKILITILLSGALVYLTFMISRYAIDSGIVPESATWVFFLAAICEVALAIITVYEIAKNGTATALTYVKSAARKLNSSDNGTHDGM